MSDEESDETEYVQLREDDTEPDPLRLSDLIRLLNTSGRYTKCPSCDHKGPWEIATTSDQPNHPGDDPKLTLYRIHVGEGQGDYHTTVAMTCPRCGHFAQISSYKIRELKNTEVPNG